MKQVIWYSGVCDIAPKARKHILKESILDNPLDILPEQEKERYAIPIKYCLRTIWSGDEYVIDYGSHAKFIYYKELEDDK